MITDAEQLAEIETIDVFVTRTMMNPADWGLHALCFMQVCAHCEVPPAQVEDRANARNPTGTSGRWAIVWGNDESDATNNKRKGPGPCSEVPGRIHYLLSC